MARLSENMLMTASIDNETRRNLSGREQVFLGAMESSLRSPRRQDPLGYFDAFDDSSGCTGTSCDDEFIMEVEIEGTICPICDEACTCPKAGASNGNPSRMTTTFMVPLEIESGRKVSGSTRKRLAKKNEKREGKKGGKYGKEEEAIIGDNLKAQEVEYRQEIETEVDPALAFIRMIYSGEDSLDEEEAFALYQATQLFSSSDDEVQAYQSFFEQNFDQIKGDGGEEGGVETRAFCDGGGEEHEEYEYTIVEYKEYGEKDRIDDDDDDDRESEKKEEAGFEPERHSEEEFVAYESDSETEINELEAREDNLLVNTIFDPNAKDDNKDWTTWSVFDISADDQEIILSKPEPVDLNNLYFSSSPSPSSSMESAKIPKIAPQVLAAISAAAKTMALKSSQRDGGCTGSVTKYFSYVTSSEGIDMDGRGEDFLFFEEEPYGTECTCGSNGDYEEIIETNTTTTSTKTKKIKIGKRSDPLESKKCKFCSTTSMELGELVDLSKTNSSSSSNTSNQTQAKKGGNGAYSQSFSSFKRWNRVPLGAFRRSRRPSHPKLLIPSLNAIKTSVSGDPPLHSTCVNQLGTGSDGTSGLEDESQSHFGSNCTVTDCGRSFSIGSFEDFGMSGSDIHDCLAIDAFSDVNGPSPYGRYSNRSRSLFLPQTSFDSWYWEEL